MVNPSCLTLKPTFREWRDEDVCDLQPLTAKHDNEKPLRERARGGSESGVSEKGIKSGRLSAAGAVITGMARLRAPRLRPHAAAAVCSLTGVQPEGLITHADAAPLASMLKASEEGLRGNKPRRSIGWTFFRSSLNSGQRRFRFPDDGRDDITLTWKNRPDAMNRQINQLHPQEAPPHP